MAWLLASALPLVAHDEVVSARENSMRIMNEQQQDNKYSQDRETPETSFTTRIEALRNRNETIRLRKRNHWSSSLAVQDDEDYSDDNPNEHTQQPWNAFDDEPTWDHSSMTDRYNASDFFLFRDTCPRVLFWNVSLTTLLSHGDWGHTTTSHKSLDKPILPQITPNATESLLTHDDSSTAQDSVDPTTKGDDAVTTDTPDDDTPQPSPVEDAQRFRVDYASKSAGALVLESSEHFQGTSNLLTNDQDAYAIIPCEEPHKSVVIGLSEDILVKQVVLANYERYSSHVKEFRVQGSMTMGNWRDFGTFTASTRKGQTTTNSSGKQTFELQKPAWARYLKFEFLTHHGNEYYCTVSQISVHGSTMLQGFHEQWEETNHQEDELQNNMEIIVTPADAVALVDTTTDMDTSAATCVTPLHSQCPMVLDFAAMEASYSSAVSAVHLASIHLVSRIKGPAPAQQRYASLQPAGVSLIPKQRTCMTNNRRRTETMKKGGWSLVNRRDEPRISTLRKLLTSIGMAPDTNAEAIVVKLAETKEETKAVASDKVINERVTNERHSVKSVVPEARKEDNEEVNQNVELPEHPVIADYVPTTDMVPEKIDFFAETGLAFAKALERLPSSRCLMDLDFPNFKTKFANSKIAGSSGHGNAQVNSPMEPIFKKLTDEIKALQASVSIHDLYAKESIICYQRVVMELMIEMESTRRDQEARLLKIEQDTRRNSPFVFLGEVWRWIFHVGCAIVWWTLDALRSIGTLVVPLSTIASPWIRSFTYPLQPYLAQVSCFMLRYISIACDSITACFMLPGTSAQLSLPYFCKV